MSLQKRFSQIFLLILFNVPSEAFFNVPLEAFFNVPSEMSPIIGPSFDNAATS